jgi:AAA domain/DnaB-like helicase N terminal domain
MSTNAYDVAAEQALLAVALTHFDEVAGAFLSVPPTAYYVPRHEILAAVIRDMAAKRLRIDPVTVVSTLMDRGLISKVPAPYVDKVLTGFRYVPNAMEYAGRVLELYGRRRLAQAMAHVGNRLEADWDSGEGALNVADVIGSLRADLDELVKYAAGVQLERPPTLAEFLAGADSFDWLVPGLLERGDRLLLTGEEGFGKSELTFQIALCVAAGVHPFTGDIVPERSVLMIDCENSATQSRRRARRIRAAVDGCRLAVDAPPVMWEKNLHLVHRRAGLDLTDGADVAWLENLIADLAPDLVTLGPLYKLHRGDINNGEMARQMLDTIDQLRERHGFAFMSECHASKAQGADGKRSLSPEGSALFLRWPEFGFGLRRNRDIDQRADVVAWRGARDERDWPGALERGYAGILPWRPTVEYYDQPGVPR